MKKMFTLAGIVALTAAANAQDPVAVVPATVVIVEQPALLMPAERYNRFSLDLQYGLNHAVNPIAPGYDVPVMGLWHAGIGARYMLNTKFGLRLGVNYDEISGSDDSPNFRTDYYRASLEGVVNVGNLLSFDQWTHCFGLLFHAGAGYSVMDNPGSDFETDHMINVVGGLTPQFRLGERVNLYFDVSMLANAAQGFTYDYTQRYYSRGLSGNLYNYSVGVQFNLGKNARHADWVPGGDRMSDLRQRIDKLERDQLDDDADGVVNHIDMEPNTPYGTLVDTKGRSIVWYSIYQEMNDKDNMNASFVNYINAYEVHFDTDKAAIEARYNRTLENIAIIMANNQQYTLTVTGHADERGPEGHNLELSRQRANAVKDFLVGKGVAASRITATGVGETQPKNPEKSEESREENRRVQFTMK